MITRCYYSSRALQQIRSTVYQQTSKRVWHVVPTNSSLVGKSINSPVPHEKVSQLEAGGCGGLRGAVGGGGGGEGGGGDL